jgi:Icc protein
VPAKPVQILHITDPHLHAHRDAMMRGLNTYDSFRSIIDRANTEKRKPDAVIATGDLVQDETREGYERFSNLVSELGVPVHCIPGNHDSPQIMAEILNKPPFQFCGSAIYQDWCLIMLNSVVRWDDGGQLETSQLEILEQTLSANESRYALICMHHHPVSIGSAWMDGGLGLRNSSDFFKIIDRYDNVRGIAWGHVHQASDRERNGVALFSTPSTCAQFLPNSDVFMMDTRPPGYRWVNLMPDGSIETEVVWLT